MREKRKDSVGFYEGIFVDFTYTQGTTFFFSITIQTLDAVTARYFFVKKRRSKFSISGNLANCSISTTIPAHQGPQNTANISKKLQRDESMRRGSELSQYFTAIAFIYPAIIDSASASSFLLFYYLRDTTSRVWTGAFHRIPFACAKIPQLGLL